MNNNDLSPKNIKEQILEVQVNKNTYPEDPRGIHYIASILFRSCDKNEYNVYFNTLSKFFSRAVCISIISEVNKLIKYDNKSTDIDMLDCFFDFAEYKLFSACFIQERNCDEFYEFLKSILDYDDKVLCKHYKRIINFASDVLLMHGNATQYNNHIQDIFNKFLDISISVENSKSIIAEITKHFKVLSESNKTKLKTLVKNMPDSAKFEVFGKSLFNYNRNTFCKEFMEWAFSTISAANDFEYTNAFQEDSFFALRDKYDSKEQKFIKDITEFNCGYRKIYCLIMLVQHCLMFREYEDIAVKVLENLNLDRYINFNNKSYANVTLYRFINDIAKNFVFINNNTRLYILQSNKMYYKSHYRGYICEALRYNGSQFYKLRTELNDKSDEYYKNKLISIIHKYDNNYEQRFGVLCSVFFDLKPIEIVMNSNYLNEVIKQFCIVKQFNVENKIPRMVKKISEDIKRHVDLYRSISTRFNTRVANINRAKYKRQQNKKVLNNVENTINNIEQLNVQQICNISVW